VCLWIFHGLFSILFFYNNFNTLIEQGVSNYRKFGRGLSPRSSTTRIRSCAENRVPDCAKVKNIYDTLCAKTHSANKQAGNIQDPKIYMIHYVLKTLVLNKQATDLSKNYNSWFNRLIKLTQYTYKYIALI
jgi:hypothetical protein